MNKQDLGHIDVDKSDDEITDNMSKKDVPLTQEEIRQFVKQQVDKLTKQNGKQADGFSPEAKEKDEENKKIELAKKKEVDKRNALINKRKKEVAAEQKKGRRKMKRGIPKKSGGIPKRGGSVAKSKSKEKEGSNTLTVFADENYLPLVNNFVKIDGMYPLITDDYLKSNLDSYSVGGFAILSACMGSQVDLNNTKRLMGEIAKHHFSFVPIYLKQLYPLEDNLDLKVSDVSFVVFPYYPNKNNLTVSQCLNNKKIEDEMRTLKDLAQFIVDVRKVVPIKHYIWDNGNKTYYYSETGRTELTQFLDKKGLVQWNRLLRWYGTVRNRNLWKAQFCFTNKKPNTRLDFCIRTYQNGELIWL